MRKKENLPFAATWKDLEGIMLREIRQTEKDKCYMISLMCGIQKAKLTEIENRMVVIRGWGVGEMGRCIGYKLPVRR